MASILLGNLEPETAVWSFIRKEDISLEFSDLDFPGPEEVIQDCVGRQDAAVTRSHRQAGGRFFANGALTTQ